jgi:uncharacterized SAM-binding protein YcdF (DUF218 family)
MTASNLAVAVATVLLLPPLNVLLLALVGALLLWRGWRRAGRGLLILSLLAGVALSTPLFSEILVSRLESRAPPLLHPREQQAQAIVILSGGRLRHASEYDGRDQPSPLTLGRMRYGAWLHEQTGLPILVTGGSPEGYGEAEAVLMARALKDSFKVPVRWQETASDNTAENARNSRAILQKEGIKRILLVTDALHMPRSVRIFERYGFDVVPAPTNRRAAGHISFTLLSLLPQAWYLASSRDALHEWIGMLWYDVRYQDDDRVTSSP